MVLGRGSVGHGIHGSPLTVPMLVKCSYLRPRHFVMAAEVTLIQLLVPALRQGAEIRERLGGTRDVGAFDPQLVA